MQMFTRDYFIVTHGLQCIDGSECVFHAVDVLITGAFFRRSRPDNSVEGTGNPRGEVEEREHITEDYFLHLEANFHDKNKKSDLMCTQDKLVSNCEDINSRECRGRYGLSLPSTEEERQLQSRQ